MEKIQDWLDDREPSPQYSNRQVFEAALDHGVTDTRVIANSIALVEAAHRLHEQHPNVAFEYTVDALMNGLYVEATPMWFFRKWMVLGKLKAWLFWNVVRGRQPWG